jgi:hypothetical protein
MAAEHLPSPVAAAPERYARLLPPRSQQLKVRVWRCVCVALSRGQVRVEAELSLQDGAASGVLGNGRTRLYQPLASLHLGLLPYLPAPASLYPPPSPADERAAR